VLGGNLSLTLRLLLRPPGLVWEVSRMTQIYCFSITFVLGLAAVGACAGFVIVVAQ
jgi:hypothetical protein